MTRRRPNELAARRAHPLLKSLCITLFALTALVRGAAAQDHSQHQGVDPAFTEGRGKGVQFATSCGAEAQPKFEAALAALHSFWYAQALKEFTAIAQTHPDCAIAYWGVAMSVWNQLWAPPRPEALARGLEAVEKAKAAPRQDQRERAFIEAIAAFYTGADQADHRTRALRYARQMERLRNDYPQDRETAMFYALALLATADPLDRSYANQRQAGAILEAVFKELPEHPGAAHYLIHAYDYPELVDGALAAAERYAQVARVVPHAIHMPSHVYVLLGKWEETIRSNEAGIEAERERGIPEDRLHDIDYLVYAHLQLAQDRKAMAVRDLGLRIESDLVTQKRDVGLRARPFAVAAIEARYALERGDWSAAAGLPVRPGRFAYIEAVPHFARAVGFARSGRPHEARADLDRLAALNRTLLEQNNPYWARQTDIQHKIASGWTAYASGDKERGLALVKAAAELEQSSETHDTLSPGPIGTTAHEALGEMLLAMNRPKEALAAFEASLHAAKNRLRSWYGAAKSAASAGDVATARTCFGKVAELTKDADPERPEIKEARAYLAKAGER
jgi:hypothetical protein